jgi:hypothetical protein
MSREEVVSCLGVKRSFEFERVAQSDQERLSSALQVKNRFGCSGVLYVEEEKERRDGETMKDAS